MTDIVAELRRLYENDPVGGNWEVYGPESFGTLIFSDASPVLHHTSSVHYATADLIVAMHNHLPALLDVVDEARNVRLYHSDPGMLKAMLYRLSEALAALERSDEG